MRLSLSNSAGFLLVLNLLVSMLWFVNLGTIKLLLLSGTGSCLLLLFYAKRTSLEMDILKFIIVILLTRGLLNSGIEDYLATLAIDLSSLGLVMSFCVFKKLRYKNFSRIVIVCTILILLVFLTTMQYVDLNLVLDGDLERKEMFISINESSVEEVSSGYVIYQAQQLIVSCLIIFLLFMPLVISSFSRIQLIIILSGLTAAIISYSAFYRKRQSLVEFLLLIALTITLHKKSFSHILPNNALLYLIIIGAGSYFMVTSDLLVNVFDRFQQVTDINKFDRVEEAMFVLNEFSAIDWILGKGLGYKAVDTPGGSILHIGYANLVMKGGLILLSFYLFQSIKNFRYCLAKSKEDSLYLVGCSITIFSMLSLTYSPGYHWFLISTVMGLSMFSRYSLELLILDKNKELVNKHVND